MTKAPQLSALERMLGSWSAVQFFMMCFAISQTWILLTLGSTGEDVGRLQTMCLRHPTTSAQTGQAARKVLQRWTSRDIHNFQRHFALDFWIHPILYALFFAAALLYDLHSRQAPPPKTTTDNRLVYGRLGTLLVFAAALCDMLENVRHHSIEFKDNHEVIAPDEMLYEACVFASTKWFIMGCVSMWLVWRYFYAPPLGTCASKQQSTSSSTIPNDWNGPLAQDFLNTPGPMGLLEAQGHKIPWTLTAPNTLYYNDRSYTVSPFAHYIGYAQDEIPMHFNDRPMLKFVFEVLLKIIGYAFCVLGFDDCIYFNNYRLSTNLWPAEGNMQWSQEQVEAINQDLLQAAISNTSIKDDNNINTQPQRAIVWRSVDPLSQPTLTKTLLEHPSCLMIPARVVNWCEFETSFDESDILQKKNFQRDLQLFRERVGWDILKQKHANSNDENASTDGFIMKRLDPVTVTDHEAVRIVGLYNQLYIDKYSNRNPKLTPDGLMRLAKNGFFAVDVLQRRDGGHGNGHIVAFCTWSIVDGVGISSFVGYDIANDQDKELYRLVMMMIHNNVVASGVKKWHLSGGANHFKRRRGANSSLEYIAVFVDRLPYYRHIPWWITKRVADKVITVERAK